MGRLPVIARIRARTGVGVKEIVKLEGPGPRLETLMRTLNISSCGSGVTDVGLG